MKASFKSFLFGLLFLGFLGLSIVSSSSSSERTAAAGEPTLPFHATLQITEDCESSPARSEKCQHFDAWVSECLAEGYDWGFQAVRAGDATTLGPVTSFEQGCLDYPESGPPALVRSYVQLTISERGGRNTLQAFAQALFDFAQATPPATGTFTVTGGTGRWARTRGNGTLGNGVGDMGPGTIIDLDGVLRPQHGER